LTKDSSDFNVALEVVSALFAFPNLLSFLRSVMSSQRLVGKARCQSQFQQDVDIKANFFFYFVR
jgi:hypothetical protein